MKKTLKQALKTIEKNVLICVVWRDANSCVEWQDKEELAKTDLSEIKTVGFLGGVKKDMVTILHNFCTADEAADHTNVPTGCIIRIYTLKISEQVYGDKK